ncbi:MAG: hypothetical protein GF334_12130 [Candidatus Altiarchaeales archaeon]|nr:hypothetical protein [Candidatus Altiarchaeales archaeon]
MALNENLFENKDITWRDILTQVLVDMNPWDVDLIEIATRYTQKVEEMRDMNFQIPGNVLIVSAVLLRMKADILAPKKAEDTYNLRDQLLFVFDSDYPVEALVGQEQDPYPLEVKPSRMVKRRVTAEELIDAINGVLFEKKRVKKNKLAERGRPEVYDIVVGGEKDIVLLVEETFEAIIKQLTRLPGRSEVVLSEIAKSREELISMFLSLLHLVTDKRLKIRQEALYEEIYINVV